MITTLNSTNRFAGLSTDQKPTVGVANGSKFIEIDTGKKYLYNAAGEAWVEYTGGGGGGADSLPTPTADNVGKSLTVIATPVDGEVIVPEQTVNCVKVGEMSPMATLADVAQELFINGETIIVTFDDSSIEMTIEEWQIGGVETYGFIIVSEWDDIENVTKFNLYTNDAGEHTIKVVQKQARTFDEVIPEQEITVEDPSTPVSLTADEYPIAAGDTILVEIINEEFGTEKYYTVTIDDDGYIKTSETFSELYGFGILFYDGASWAPEYMGFEGTYKVKVSKVIYQYSYSYGFDGSGLPAPTASDSGKSVVASVQEIDGAVIVPEQTGILDAGLNLSFICDNADASLFTEGTQVIGYVNGTRYETTVVDEGGFIMAYLSESPNMGFVFSDDNLGFYNTDGNDGDEVTVKLCVLDNKYGYAFDEFAGYDLVIQNTASPRPNYDDSTDDFTIIKGSIEECENKILAGKIVRGLLVYSFVNVDNQPIESVMELCFFDGSYREIWFYTKYTSRGGVCMIVFEYDSDYAIYNYRYMHDDGVNEA